MACPACGPPGAIASGRLAVSISHHLPCAFAGRAVTKNGCGATAPVCRSAVMIPSSSPAATFAMQRLNQARCAGVTKSMNARFAMCRNSMPRCCMVMPRASRMRMPLSISAVTSQVSCMACRGFVFDPQQSRARIKERLGGGISGRDRPTLPAGMIGPKWPRMPRPAATARPGAAHDPGRAAGQCPPTNWSLRTRIKSTPILR